MTLTGPLYRLSLECLYLELGSFRPLGLLPFLQLGHLTSNSLIKSTWEFLYKNQLYLQSTPDNCRILIVVLRVIVVQQSLDVGATITWA
jgi:hypothetical protein